MIETTETEANPSRRSNSIISIRAAHSTAELQERFLYPLGLLILIVSRIGLQGLLYRAGFLALTADDYGRMVLAARWAQQPFLLWRGAWLPFHMYLYGTALQIRWDLLTEPRLIAICIGAISILLIYRLAVTLFDRRSAGLLAALFLAFNPAHVWLSATPLTEIPATTLVIGCFLCFVLFLRNNRPSFLFLSAGLLAIANGFRYEAWMLSVVYSLYLTGYIVYRLVRKRIGFRASIPFWIAAFLPWLFPIAWLLGNYLLTENPLYFLGEITSYKLSHYGTERSYWFYLQTLIQLDPFNLVLGIAGCGLMLKRLRASESIQWYLVMVWAPFVIFAFLHGGQQEPPGNSIRYLAPFFFLVYPAAGFAADSLIRRFRKESSLRFGLVVLITAGILAFQVRNAFQFVNDPASEGLAVGQALRDLRSEQSKTSARSALIEVSYWQYLAIHIGANDISDILYDRPLDYSTNAPPSLLLEHPSGLDRCITRYDIAYIIMKSPDLVHLIQAQLNLSPVETVNGYTFFQVPEEFTASGGECPMKFSKAETRVQDGQ